MVCMRTELFKVKFDCDHIVTESTSLLLLFIMQSKKKKTDLPSRLTIWEQKTQSTILKAEDRIFAHLEIKWFHVYMIFNDYENRT